MLSVDFVNNNNQMNTVFIINKHNEVQKLILADETLANVRALGRPFNSAPLSNYGMDKIMMMTEDGQTGLVATKRLYTTAKGARAAKRDKDRFEREFTKMDMSKLKALVAERMDMHGLSKAEVKYVKDWLHNAN